MQFLHTPKILLENSGWAHPDSPSPPAALIEVPGWWNMAIENKYLTPLK